MDLQDDRKYDDVRDEEVLKETVVRSQLEEVLIRERPNPWARHMIQLYMILIPAYLCSTTSGFDSNTFGGASVLPAFRTYFDLDKGNTQGLLGSMYQVGNIVACLVAAPIADKWGRKVSMGMGSAICILGAVLQVAATGGPMLIVGRVILGVGATIGFTAAPAYVVEWSHPAYRGILTGFYNAMFFSGTMLSGFILFGLSYVPGTPDWGWRVPMSLQAAPSLFVVILIWFVPESPRWYMARGNTEKARELLVKYHGNGNPASEVVELEMREMAEKIETAGTDKRWWDYRGLGRTAGDRHRFFLVLCVSFLSTWNLPPTSYYLPLMVQAAGVTNEHTVLLLNALQAPIMMAAALTGLQFVERWGRRPSLMLSSSGETISVIMVTVCTALVPHHPKAGPAGIAFLFIFLAVFAFVWTPMQSLYPSEVLSFNNRAKGLAAHGFVGQILSFFNTYVPPIAIKKAGWKFYLFYACWDFIGIFVIYFCFVETKGRNLEEIDDIFADTHPVKRSLRKTKARVVAGDQGIEVRTNV